MIVVREAVIFALKRIDKNFNSVKALVGRRFPAPVICRAVILKQKVKGQTFMPKIGMPSCAILAVDWIDALKVAAENGFDAFEVSCIFPSADPENTTPDQVEQAKEIVAKSEMEICVHAPFVELNTAAYSRGIREGSVEVVKKGIDFCHDLSGEIVIVHSGTITYDQLKGIARDQHPLMQIHWDHNIESLKQINGYANSKGITVCLENIGFNSIDQTFEDLMEIREVVGESLKFTLDFGHARLHQGAEKAIDLLGEHIRHIHLTDNFGAKDDHLPVGDGDFDLSPFLDFFRNFAHIITLETLELSEDPAPVLRGFKNFKRML